MSRADRPSVLPGIQYLRGLAAVSVVFDHCSTMMGLPQYGDHYVEPIMFYGRVGVPLFFCI